MLEAAALLFVAAVAVATLAVMRLRARKPPGPAELQRLREHIAWLEDRQRHAEERHWDDAMKARIAAQLEQAHRDLAAGEARPPAR